MKKRLLLITAALGASILVACGGGGGDEVISQSSADLTLSVNAANVAAFSGSSFAFDAVPDFGTTGTTTLAVSSTNGTNTYNITSGGKTASGPLGFGSCIFRAGTSDFQAPSPLAQGNTVTISLCSITATTTGVPATGSATQVKATMSLNGKKSAATSVFVVVRPDGTVSLSADGKTFVDVGKVELKDLTGIK